MLLKQFSKRKALLERTIHGQKSDAFSTQKRLNCHCVNECISGQGQTYNKCFDLLKDVLEENDIIDHPAQI